MVSGNQWSCGQKVAAAGTQNENSKIDEHNTDYLPRFVFLYGICRAIIMVECQLQLRNRTSVNQM
jgi:hypothetical protein